MMKRATLIAVGIVATAVAVLLLLSSNGKASRHQKQNQRIDDTATVNVTSSPRALGSAADPKARARMKASGHGIRSVRPSSRERRPDENDRDYGLRMLFLDEYESFVRDANLTEEQQQQMLALLADMQEQAVLTHDEIWQNHVDVKARGGDLRDQMLSSPGRHAFIVLRDEMLERSREFLDPQQHQRLKGGMLASSSLPYLAGGIEFFEISYGPE